MNIKPIQIINGFLLSCTFLLSCMAANDTQKGEVSYPHKFTYNGNPLVRTHGAADPDAHVWNDTVWVYCSQDHEVVNGDTYATMDGYHAFSSTDLVNWTDHGEVLHSRDISWGVDGYMWAPCAAHKNGKYYLYYPHIDKKKQWRVGVAISDQPQGPFKDMGQPIEGLTGIDPSVFIDDDGQAYIYNGHYIMAKLKENMIELAEPVKKLSYAPFDVLEDDKRRFHEGPFMHKRNGKYYFSYSNFKNSDYQGWYAMGDNPYGPFKWMGPMAENPQGAQDHHSVIEFKGQWYYFYHIAIHDIPVNKVGQGRIMCFDRMHYNNDDTIQIVRHTRGPTKTLNTLAEGGSILLDPPGGAYAPGTEVQVTALGELGKHFASWGGDLSGKQNPTKIVVDQHKSISASFTPCPTFSLETKSEQGRIFMNPPGGVYSQGQKVALTVVDDFGYDFSSWTGDLAGIENPVSITMDGNKKVNAQFVTVPIFAIQTKAENGIIELSPPGPRYEIGTEITIKAKADYGFGFTSWSNDLSEKDASFTFKIEKDMNIQTIFTDLKQDKVAMAINCGGKAYRSNDGVYYSADQYAKNGGTYSKKADISGTEDDYLYRSERMGHDINYSIPLKNGIYKAVLQFAEIYHGGKGSRIFDVAVESLPTRKGIDIVAKSKPYTAYEEVFDVEVKDGILDIHMTTIKDNAKISAIRILQ
ncbi:MAG: family 43 glycosylhydrolase [Planctomycetes bacterium]|nr:family 43 glycosylhydrolase [Planctomycetota bacterium]